MKRQDEHQRMKRVYVAGPITLGNTMHNIYDAVQVGNKLMSLGFCPFVPHVTCLWDMISPHAYEDWCRWDDEWLRQCDAVLRMDGESKGADAEVKLAIQVGIPVFYTLIELIAWRDASHSNLDE